MHRESVIVCMSGRRRCCCWHWFVPLFPLSLRDQAHFICGIQSWSLLHVIIVAHYVSYVPSSRRGNSHSVCTQSAAAAPLPLLHYLETIAKPPTNGGGGEPMVLAAWLTPWRAYARHGILPAASPPSPDRRGGVMIIIGLFCMRGWGGGGGGVFLHFCKKWRMVVCTVPFLANLLYSTMCIIYHL